ncbi:hypothetical protein BU26DRAFT_426918 [Trematosphaeria pertusa]|uniref:Uncharacterized protein n=1 Tax=Trematosphaeria pertusa TaxID=390896 RepID=A0A6A6IGG7_9PLEO|nr:uncharacterized protein BU26DRAFT_426918 [Trematosphaeria pertusa]KAF2248992.1 hypothetical protein BU26DRAFT_426918 [Trematosphaeria pertusa]
MPLLESNIEPATSLYFNGDAAVFDEKATTVTFPAALYIVPSKTNGTWINEAIVALKSPTATAKRFTKALHRKAASLDWATLKHHVSDLADTATEELNARLNRAFEGRDAVEMGNKVVDCIPSVSLPSIHQISQAVDALSDAVQNLMERNPPQSTFVEEDLQGSQWLFARLMGEKARWALVRQGICAEWQMLPGRDNLEWQMELNQALARVFVEGKHEYRLSQLLEMEPLWIGDRDGASWRLVIDTGFADISLSEGNFIDSPVYLRAGFELAERSGCVSVADYTRGTRGVEGDWEMVD